MLMFTVKRGSLGDKPRGAADLPQGVKTALYLNILGIIVLKEPAEHFDGELPEEPPHAFGVDSIAEDFRDVKEEVGQEDDNGQYL